MPDLRFGPWLAVAAVFALHVLTLTADPPDVPNGQGGLELVVEAPAKAHEARVYALTGSFDTYPADNYRIWGVQSPAYVRPLSWFLRAFGASLWNVRLYGVLLSLLGAVLLVRSFAAELQPTGRALVLALGLGSFYAFHYARAGLLEPQLNTLLIVSASCAVASFSRAPAWSIGAMLSFALAVLTKQSAVVFLPALLFSLVVSVRRAVAEGRRAELVAIGAVALGLGLGLGVYVRAPAYVATLRWNYAHALQGKEALFHGPASSVWHDLGARLAHVLERRRWLQAVIWVLPVAFPLSALAALRHLGGLLRGRRPSPTVALLLLWFGAALGAVLLLAHARGRFSLVLLPPAFALAGLELDHRWGRLARPGRAVLLAVVGGLLAITHVGWHARWLGHLDHEIAGANAAMAGLVGPGDAVVGRWAPLFAFDTQAATFYVKHHFNTDPARLAALAPTHLLDRDLRTARGRALLRRFGGSPRTSRLSGSFRALGQRHDLYALRAVGGGEGQEAGEDAHPAGAADPQSDEGQGPGAREDEARPAWDDEEE